MAICNTKKENFWDKDNKSEWFPLTYLFFLIILAIFIGAGIYISL